METFRALILFNSGVAFLCYLLFIFVVEKCAFWVCFVKIFQTMRLMYIVLREDDVLRDLETDFPCLHYGKFSGVTSVGQPRVYTEEYAELDGADVFVSDVLKQGECTLALHFFSGDGDYSMALRDYEAFMEFIVGHQFYWFDTFRNRVLLLHLESSVTPKKDEAQGMAYISVEIKFKNDWGRSYGLDDCPVEKVKRRLKELLA